MENQFIRVPTPKDLDIISDLKFSKQLNQFLVSSWDDRILLYDCNYIDQPSLSHEFKSSVTITSIEYLKNNTAYLGSLDGRIFLIDYENGVVAPENIIPTNTDIDNGINNLLSFQDSLLVTSTFNKHLYIHDPRSAVPILSKQLPKKIFKMDTTSTLLTLGMSERTVEVYDHRNWKSPFQIRESGLKLQINDLKTFPDEQGFAISSIDGRVSVEYYDPSPEVQSKKYAFKCHRKTDSLTKTDVVYPVNSILFHKPTNHLYTSGSDGFINIWNWETKRKFKQSPRFTTDDGTTESIVKMAFNHNDSIIAVATSDDGFKNSTNVSYVSPQFPSHIYINSIN